jgi:hypothetical protein
MSRPKLTNLEKKVKVSITISRKISDSLSELTNNKSALIEKLLTEYVKNN